MEAATLKALKGSIKKWKDIAAGTGVNKGAKNCPLCKIFLFGAEGPDCVGCPVYESADHGVREGCCNTPYVEFTELEEPDVKLSGSIWTFKAVSPKAKRLARKEQKFLESLLPKKKPPRGVKPGYPRCIPPKEEAHV